MSGAFSQAATDRMMLQVLSAVAEHERASMLERQREGIAKAKAQGKYKGPSANRHGKRPARARSYWRLA